MNFTQSTILLKALADETRLRIVHILSCGELCACDILEYFDISQPTLSHHLNILVVATVVSTRPDGKWTYYRMNKETVSLVEQCITKITSETENCICKKTRRNCK